MLSVAQQAFLEEVFFDYNTEAVCVYAAPNLYHRVAYVSTAWACVLDPRNLKST